jgi:glycosyltransferase involved in cell wall biosynthesis
VAEKIDPAVARPIRILLVGNFELQGSQSMPRYAHWLHQALTDRGYQATILQPRPFFSLLTGQPTVRKFLGYIDMYLLFPLRLRMSRRGFDLAHVLDHSNSMYLAPLGSVPRLITCHDMLAIRSGLGEFEQQRIGRLGRIQQRWILSGLRKAPNVLCVSAKTAQDLQRLAPKPEANVRVVHSATNWNYHPVEEMPASVRAKLDLADGEQYLFHLSGGQWYKNQTGVVRIFASLLTARPSMRLRLAVAGKNFTGEARRLATELGVADRIALLGKPDNEEVQALYSHALAFLFPSLEEGFGWPILEAQACGCPVITSNRPPMTEVGGDAAIYVDPCHISDRTAEEIFAQLEPREALRQAGFENLKRFTESTVVDHYCDFYREILQALPQR